MPPVGSPVRKKIFGEKPKADAVTDAAPEAVKAEAVPDDADDVVFADEATPPAPKKSVTADIGNRFRAEVRRAASMRRGRVLIAAGWTVLALFVAGTLGGGWIYRDRIAAWWPATSKVYAAVGEEINLRGFEFRNVSYERQTEEGLPVLAITGEVVNVSGERAVLPRLRVGLLDEEQKELYHWTLRSPRRSCRPARRRPSSRGCRARRQDRATSRCVSCRRPMSPRRGMFPAAMTNPQRMPRPKRRRPSSG